jgi:hypothetical protein
MGLIRNELLCINLNVRKEIIRFWYYVYPLLDVIRF